MSSLGVKLGGRRICLSRTDGGRWVDGSQALAAGPGRGAHSGNGQDRLASQASRERPRVWAAVGSLAGFPGCSGVSWCFSGPWTAPAPLSRGPRVHACRPFPAAAGLSSSSRACDCPRSLPLPGTEPASPHVGVVPGPPSAGGFPGRSSALGALTKGAGGEPCACEGRGGRGYAAGERSPGPAAALGVAVAVGASSVRMGAPVHLPGRAAGPPLCWEASCSEIPRWALAADSRPPQVAFSHSPRGGARPSHLRRRFRGVGLAWPHPVGARLSPSVRLSLLAACCSLVQRPGVSRFPGPPRPQSVARFATAGPPLPPPVRRCRRSRVLDEGERP